MAQYPVTFETGKHYRVDKSYIWLGPIVAIAAVLFFAIVSNLGALVDLYFAFQSGFDSSILVLVVGLFVLGLAVIFGLIVLIYYLAYKNMSYVFDELELSFYSGIFVKKRVHLPYERVQSVNQHADLIQRLAGVCSVVVDSAGGSSNKGVRIPYVRLQIAERIRSDLFVRKAALVEGTHVTYVSEDALSVQPVGVQQSIPTNVLDSTLGPVGEWRGAFGGASYVDEPVTFEFGLSNKQLALASFTHPGSLVGGLITALVMIFLAALCWELDYIVGTFLAFISIPLVIGVSLVVWVIASIGILLSYGNFKVRRRGTRIEVERGLIARHFSGIDISRIQSVNFDQSLMRRLIHYCELSLGRIDVQSNDMNGKNSESKGLLIHPFLPCDQIEQVLRGLLPEYDACPSRKDCKPLPPVALRRSVLRRCFFFNWALWSGLVCMIGLLVVRWCLVVANGDIASIDPYFEAIFQAALFIVVLCVVVATAVAAIGAVLWARHSGYCIARRFLVIHNDGLSTSTALLPRQKIQSGHTRMNPFQHRLGLKTIVATTAAGFRKTDVRLIDIPQTDAAVYLDWLH